MNNNNHWKSFMATESQLYSLHFSPICITPSASFFNWLIQIIERDNWSHDLLAMWQLVYIITHKLPDVVCDFWGSEEIPDSDFLTVWLVIAQVQFTWAAEDFVNISICVSESLCHIVRIWVQLQDAKTSTSLSSGLKLIRFPGSCMTPVSFLWVRWKKKPHKLIIG